MGPNMVLDKGFLVDTATTGGVVNRFRLVKLTSNTQVKQCDTSGELALGVVQDAIADTAKVATGKVTVDVRILGISRCTAGGAITRFTRVRTDTTGRAVALAGTAGVNENVVGLALTPASTAGDLIDLLLTPANTSNSAVS